MARVKFPAWTDATSDAASAVYGIAAETLEIVRAQEWGICADDGVEHCHDHRVGLRRVRSLMRLAKDVVDPETRTVLRRELGVLARSSNRLRDLDVQLADQAGLQAMVPVELHEGLQIVFAEARRARAQEQVAVADWLQSEEAATSWQCIDEAIAAAAPGPQGSERLAAWMPERMRRAHRRLIKSGRVLGDAPEDSAIHQVRINGKQLRYLLDLFGPAVDGARAKSLIQALKRLQDCLGRANDLAVQRSNLLNDACVVVDDGATVNLALGALIGSVHQQLRSRRTQVRAAIGRFDSKAMRALVKTFGRG
ncbi:MAG: CHAD domain-containing protein [Planctomycetota bacterium]|jgi:CHAD domain-containing protein|nr:CHAD domain-containing protein [Planctomycetota bacterium]